MGLKDWIAPFITLLIGASTIFISYKNYQAQAAAKPSELARLELWSKLLTEAGLDLNALPDPEKLTSDQRVVLENYRVFLKRASLESKLRKVGIDSNRIFSLLMKRAHSSVKPTPIPIGDSISYYRLILRALLYIWVPLAVIFIGVPIIVVTIAYLIGLFTNHRGNLSDFALSPLAVVLLIVGAVAVGALVYLQNRIISAIIANNVYFYFWDIYGSKKGARDSAHAYSERLAAKTYADQLFLGQQEFAHQFRENMYMAGIQEIDEYPRVLSDSVMLPRNYRVVETTEGEQGVSGQPVETPAQDKQEDVQKAPEAPISEEPIVAEVPVEAPAEDPADAPTEPVTGSATEPSAAAVAVSGADDPTEAFTRIPHDAASEEPGAEKLKN